MDINKLGEYKNKLMKQKERINQTIEAVNEENAGISQRESSNDLSMIDNHPADLATEMFDKERDLALIGNEKHLLAEVEKALNRVETGDYGKCSSCGKEIPLERLDYLPSATTCIECEQNAPNYQTYKYDRPVEEIAMGAFGPYFMDNSNDPEQEVEFNAEDSWQEVERINVYKGHQRLYDRPASDVRTYKIDNEGEDDGEDDEDDGYVELTDKISNQYYKQQLP